MQKVIGEVFPDHLALKAAADDEVVDAVSRIDLEDVPQNGPPTDYDQGLALELGLFRYAGAQTARKNYESQLTTPPRPFSANSTASVFLDSVERLFTNIVRSLKLP